MVGRVEFWGPIKTFFSWLSIMAFFGTVGLTTFVLGVFFFGGDKPAVETTPRQVIASGRFSASTSWERAIIDGQECLLILDTGGHIDQYGS
jgi:hypothetical protein